MPANAERRHYRTTFAILAAAAAAFSLLQTIVAPALREIQLETHTSTGTVAWVMTGYLLSASVAIPISGRLGDMFGKKRMLVLSLLALIVGLVISALAGSIELIVAGRIVQGLGGAVFPLAFSIVRDEFPPERVPLGIALISGLLGIGGGLGIVLAGPIVEHLSYHWLFWLPCFPVVLAAIGAAVFVPESPERHPGRVDLAGAALLAGWLLALLVGVTQAERWGWISAGTLGLLGAGAILLAVWVAVEHRVENPLVDMRMMRVRAVWTTNLAAVLFGFGMMGAFLLVPQFVQMPESTGYGFGAGVTEAGLYLLPSTLFMILLSPLSGRLSRTVGSHVPLLAGSLLGAASFALLALFHGSAWSVVLGTSLMGCGLGLAWPSMANLIVEAVPSSQTGVATGMNTIMRTIGGAIGGQLAAAVLVASAAPGGLPREHGFTIAFTLAAGALAVTVVAALAVPRRPGQSGLRALRLVPSDSTP